MLAAWGLLFDSYQNEEPFAGFLPALYIEPLKRQTTPSDIADFLFEEDIVESRVSEVVSYYQKAYDLLLKYFGVTPKRLTVRIYRSRERFLLDLKDIAGMSEDSVGFFASSGAPRPIGGQFYVPPDLTTENICHELAHSFIEAVSGEAYRNAKWLDEGYASYFARKYCSEKTWPRPSSTPLKISEMTTEDSWHTLAGTQRDAAYLKSMLMVKALVDRYKEDTIIVVIKDLRDVSLGEALKKRLGISLVEVNEMNQP